MRRKHSKGNYGSSVKLSKVHKAGRQVVWRLRFLDRESGTWRERTFREYEAARAMYEAYNQGVMDEAARQGDLIGDTESMSEMFAVRLWRKFGSQGSLLQHVLQFLHQYGNSGEVSQFSKELLGLLRTGLSEMDEGSREECGLQLSAIASDLETLMPMPSDDKVSMQDVVLAYRKERALMLERGQCRSAHHRNVLHELEAWLLGWEERDVAGITPQEIDGKLDSFRYQGRPLSNTSKFRYRGTLKSFFIWAIRHGYVRRNPVELTVAPSRDHVSIGILSPSEFRQLLAAAMEFDRPMLSRIVLQGLCGLRRSEAVQFREKPQRGQDVFVSREIAKGPRGKTKDRYVPMTAQVQAWLDAGEWESMTRDDELRYGYRLEQLAARAGIRMPKNALRHSFASYQAALHPLPDVARWMGHHGTQMTESHYRQGVSRKAAEAFFSIMPEDDLPA